MRGRCLLASLALIAASANAQLPFLSKRAPAQPVLQGIDALRADFAAQSGATTIYFADQSMVLSPQARAILAAQAAWLRRHADSVVRIEGYGDAGDTRDHALAVGAGRAEAARDQLMLLGVPAAQVSTTSWGKERPGLARAVTILVR
jgi:peptidoglycan-associated lipoprotein